jgi:hypothetical protein
MRRRVEIGVNVSLPNTGFHCDCEMSTSLADSQQLAKPFAANVFGGENPAGNDGKMTINAPRQRLIDVDDSAISTDGFFDGLVRHEL